MMQQKKITSTSFLIFLFSCLYSQENATFHRITFKFTPTALLNPNTASALAGMEVRPHSRLGLQAEYGPKSNKIALANWHSERENWQYHKIKTELRYYFLIDKDINIFLSGGYFIVQQRYAKLNDYVKLHDHIIYHYERSDIQRKTTGFTTTFGMIFQFFQYFSAELYFGAGWKKTTIQHSLSNALQVDKAPFEEWFTDKDRNEGTWHNPHLDFGIKTCFSFWKNRRHQPAKN